MGLWDGEAGTWALGWGKGLQGACGGVGLARGHLGMWGSDGEMGLQWGDGDNVGLQNGDMGLGAWG